MPRLVVTAVVALLVGVLAGCSNDAKTQTAEVLAGDLARALTARELAAVPVAEGGQEQLESILAGVSDTPATVTVDAVAVDGDEATATLAWQWDTRGEPWRYEAPATMTWAGDAWTVQWSPAVVEPSLVAGESLEATTLPARRGDILGAGDEPLVTLRPVVHVGLDKATVPAAEATSSARALAGLVGIDTDSYATQVAQAGPRAFVAALVLREADARQIDRAALGAIPGAVALNGELPLAPTRTFGAGILGRVGAATAEIVTASAGAVRPGDEVGLSGLQARYDAALRGTPVIRVSVVGAGEERTLFSTDPTDGKPLRTTLDAGLQGAAESALEDVGPASAVVALRPSTGELLTAANGPGSHSNNTATAGRYAPGSTMKVVTALALMRAGLRPSDLVPCTATVVVDGKRFTNYDAYPADRMGDIPLSSAVAHSCNTALISQHEKLAEDDLTEAAAALGLGVDHDLGFPAYFGEVPVPASKTGKAAAMIGQGTVQASPMAMAAVAASVAEGRTVVPRMVLDQLESAADPAVPLTREESADLRDMMRAVVTQGTATFLDDVPGAAVGAKTGTAEFGTEDPPATHAWMIATQGNLAVAVFVAEGTSGSQTAGPILEQFLRAAA